MTQITLELLSEKIDTLAASVAQLLQRLIDNGGEVLPPAIDLSNVGMPVKLRQQALSLIDEWGLPAGPHAREVLDALPSRILFPRAGHELTEGEQSLLDAAYWRAYGQTKAEQIEYTQNLIRGTLPGYYHAIGPGGELIEGLGLHPDPNPAVRQRPIKYRDEVIKDRAYGQMRRDIYNAITKDNPGRQIVDGMPRD